MKIVNSTCYNSDDIEALVKAAVAASVASGTQSRLPSELHVGYYTPSKATIERARNIRYSGTYGRPHLVFAKVVSNYKGSSNPRLGIIKRGMLYSAPLQAVASAAADELCVPPNVLRGIAEAIWESFIRPHRGYGPSTDYCWVSGHKIRYLNRVKRGTLTEAKDIQKKLKIQQKRSKIALIGQEIRSLERQIANAAARRSQLEGEVSALEAEA